MDGAEIVAEAATLSGEIAAAVDSILDAAQAALACSPQAAVVSQLNAIILACAIHDIAGQRLQRITEIARYGVKGSTDPEGLLNGPAQPGGGLDQAAADALFLS